ncbi:MAG TPA: DUF4199 domain-containing protein [Flavobacterium sp.]
MRNFKIEFKWGIIFTIISMLWSLLEKSVGLHDEHIADHPIYTNLFAIVAVITYVVAIKDKKKNHYHGEMTWTQGFLSGLIMSVIIALLAPLAMYITFKYISPDYFKNIIEYTVDKKIHTRQAAESFFTLKGYILQGIFGGLSMGVVTAAIVSLFVKTPKENVL